jgi:uncharacterized repeat protein (TIGR01451 family)
MGKLASFVIALVLIAGIAFGAYNQIVKNNDTANAGLNCPTGSQLNTAGTGCVSTTPSSYTCPSGQTVSGTNCVTVTCQTGTLTSGSVAYGDPSKPDVCIFAGLMFAGFPTTTVIGPATPIYGTVVTSGVTYTPDVTSNKLYSTDGINWSSTITAFTGQQVFVRLLRDNTGTTSVNDVNQKDTIPSPFTYVPGSFKNCLAPSIVNIELITIF